MNNTSLQPLAKIIKERRYKVNVRAGYIELLLRIITITLIGYIIFTEVFQIARVNGQGMFPSVKDGDVVLGYRLQNEYLIDDVIVRNIDGEMHVSRVIARETDVVDINDLGELRVNGTLKTGEIMFPTYAKDGMEYPYKVPEGYIFVLGDYRTAATDSRDFGPVALENIESKVITLVRRRGL